MAPPTLIFFVALLGFACIHAQIWKKQPSMIFEKFDNCPEYHNYTSVIRNVKINVVNNVMELNFETHVLKDSKNILEGIWEIERCASREKLDTCMMFTRMRTSRYCNLFEQKGEAWTPLMTCVKPKMVCPLRKGVYSGKNCSVDAAAFRFFPLEGSYWRVKAKILESKAMRMCVQLFAYIKEH